MAEDQTKFQQICHDELLLIPGIGSTARENEASVEGSAQRAFSVFVIAGGPTNVLDLVCAALD